eukprot:TRINITY_DN938_c0_g1_i1.p1 TRINITY_DN938_c0_g1~~TRINITY_DN938_c0_g1_i1.p1  ORF type:complete len:480 (-),score=112.80 TRINITY_DN938_c0_g1_i1:71-1435(-)
MAGREDKNTKIISDLMKLPENKNCFICNSKGPVYVCTTFNTFVCTSCSGVHRDFSHRVKSIHVASFSPQEIESLKKGGNKVAREKWLVNWKPSEFPAPDTSDKRRVKDFIQFVFVQKKWAKKTSKKKKSSKADNGSAKKKRSSQKAPIVEPLSNILGNNIPPITIDGHSNLEANNTHLIAPNIQVQQTPSLLNLTDPFDPFSGPATPQTGGVQTFQAVTAPTVQQGAYPFAQQYLQHQAQNQPQLQQQQLQQQQLQQQQLQQQQLQQQQLQQQQLQQQQLQHQQLQQQQLQQQRLQQQQNQQQQLQQQQLQQQLLQQQLLQQQSQNPQLQLLQQQQLFQQAQNPQWSQLQNQQYLQLLQQQQLMQQHLLQQQSTYYQQQMQQQQMQQQQQQLQQQQKQSTGSQQSSFYQTPNQTQAQKSNQGDTNDAFASLVKLSQQTPKPPQKSVNPNELLLF